MFTPTVTTGDPDGISEIDSSESRPRKSDNKKGMNYDDDDTGVVLIDDDLVLDEQTELEERKAYLEEARSQDSSD